LTSSFSDGTNVVTPLVTQGYESTRSSANVFNAVIGRSYPDVTLMPAGLRTGTLTSVFTTEAESARFEALHVGTSVITFMDTDLPSVGMSYVVDGSIRRQLDPESRLYWIASVDFREVRP
jgi:hypothetical protein